MAPLPESEIERIKRETDLVALVQAAGVELRRHGARRSLLTIPSLRAWARLRLLS